MYPTLAAKAELLDHLGPLGSSSSHHRRTLELVLQGSYGGPRGVLQFLMSEVPL